MIKQKKGNLITAAQDGEVSIIAHQCNCFCNMGSGIAPQIAKAFPEAQKADNDTIRGAPQKLGTLSIGTQPRKTVGSVVVFNLYGQYSHQRPRKGEMNTDYDALRLAMTEMKRKIQQYGWEHVPIGLPKIGCGLGGGDWAVVYAMIDEILGEFDVTIYQL